MILRIAFYSITMALSVSWLACSEGGGEGAVGEPEVGCELKVTGVVQSEGAGIDYSGAQISADARFVSGKSCLSSLTLALSIDGGCKLDLDLDGSQGKWRIVAASFAGDSACGASWPADLHGAATFNPDYSFAGVGGAVEVNDSKDCAGGTLKLSGRLRFTTDKGKAIYLYLDAVTLAGVKAIAGTSADCPAEFTHSCPQPGPFGTELGSTLKDVKLFDCEMNEVYFKDLCGTPATLINLFAAW